MFQQFETKWSDKYLRAVILARKAFLTLSNALISHLDYMKLINDSFACTVLTASLYGCHISIVMYSM